ncbi:uncharacterized protein LOC123547603 isoform X2 [Mercenaria mercenaria]|uniref:uncharacterized protein LOC123547603 isoform X2 n=1 Tax=Mercenaria mercenaria TaxID=6596 RepID=UPI00234F9F47|nr:uncharacterized protein LOC123547603 isoform X2 [Mercenaria mercenaria]
MQREGIILKRNHKLELKLLTTGKDGEKSEKAEDDIFKVLQEAIENAVDSSGLPIVRHEIDRILDWVAKNDGIVNVDVYKHCIIISMSCASPSGILHAIEVFENEAFRHILSNISTDMTNELFETIAIHANFTLESLTEILACQNDNSGENQGISIPVTVSSAEGLYRFFSLNDSPKWSGSADRIAESLSSHHGEALTVEITREYKDSEYSELDEDDYNENQAENNDKTENNASVLNDNGCEVNETEMEISLVNMEQAEKSYSGKKISDTGTPTLLMEAEPSTSKDDLSSTNVSKDVCLISQENSEEKHVYSRLLAVSAKLSPLSLKLGYDADIEENIKDISERTIAAANSVKETMTDEGSRVLDKSFLMTSLSPSDVLITNMQSSLNAATRALQANKQQIISLQADIHSNVESCRGRKTAHESELFTRRTKISTIRFEIENLDASIKAHHDEACTTENGAAELVERARDLRHAARRKENRAGIGGIFGGLAGVMLTPVTGGASIVLGMRAFKRGSTSMMLKIARETLDVFGMRQRLRETKSKH